MVNTASGFLFWVVAARYYSVSDVGIGTALLSSLGIIVTFSLFGFNISLIRFMPLRIKETVFNTILFVTSISAIIAALIYLFFIDSISPSISFIKSNFIIFIMFSLANSVLFVTQSGLLSSRKGESYFLQNLMLASRIPLLIIFASFGGLGIFFSIGLAYILSSIFAFILIRNYVKFNLELDLSFTKEIFKFSFINYLANLLSNIPPYALPIIIINLLGPEVAAKYFIAYSIGSFVLIIPNSVGTSLFVEGSHGMDLKKGLIKALGAVYSILLPVFIIIYFFAGNLLGIFGKDYIESIELLRIFAFSGFLAAIYSLFLSIQYIKLDSIKILKINIVQFLALITLSYLFILKFGVIGVGYAWLVTYIIICVLIVVMSNLKISDFALKTIK